jgi:lipoprotein-anchoring transpeptidase ErfK/SrfK
MVNKIENDQPLHVKEHQRVSDISLQRKKGHWLGGLLAAVAAVLILAAPVLAQEKDEASGAAADSAAALHAPAGPGGEIAATLPRPEFFPAAPFAAPQVGPVIKRAFGDDIEKRTTAFLPDNLSDLTPVKMPQGEDRWIRVDLSEQVVVAYEGNKPIRAFVISSGLARTPTVTGEFRIKTKVKAQTMTGGSGAYYYNLPNVKWVQYFYQEYAFHGTYWHNDFGRPKSHGCINMTNADAKWLFDWAGPTWDGKAVWFNSTKDNPGTLVIVTE